MNDGEIDYSRYSRSQLEEALTRIDAGRYPGNHSKLLKELQARPAETQLAKRPDRTRTWLRLIGGYEVVGAILVAYVTFTSFADAPSFATLSRLSWAFNFF